MFRKSLITLITLVIFPVSAFCDGPSKSDIKKLAEKAVEFEFKYTSLLPNDAYNQIKIERIDYKEDNSGNKYFYTIDALVSGPPSGMLPGGERDFRLNMTVDESPTQFAVTQFVNQTLGTNIMMLSPAMKKELIISKEGSVINTNDTESENLPVNNKAIESASWLKGLIGQTGATENKPEKQVIQKTFTETVEWDLDGKMPEMPSDRARREANGRVSDPKKADEIARSIIIHLRTCTDVQYLMDEKYLSCRNEECETCGGYFHTPNIEAKCEASADGQSYKLTVFQKMLGTKVFTFDSSNERAGIVESPL